MLEKQLKSENTNNNNTKFCQQDIEQYIDKKMNEINQIMKQHEKYLLNKVKQISTRF